MKAHLFSAFKLTVLCIVFFAVIYPLLILGAAQLSYHKGKGDFTIIGQSFTEDKYFNSRPSAVNYNAAGSGGSNKGPSNPDYLSLVQARVDSLKAHNPTIEKSDISVDLITASGSGLDPDISVQGAKVQVPRISAIRGISQEILYDLIKKNTQGPLFGLLGPEKINVLQLNLSLDRIKK
jgi:K+-transporting ATPase ATPase C chain